MFKCSSDGCRVTSPEVAGAGWASMLLDAPGSIPMLLCPRCADKMARGIDPDTNKPFAGDDDPDKKSVMTRF